MRISDWSSDVCSSDLFETKGFSMMISPMPECDGREETTKQPEAKYQIYGMAGASHRSGGRKPPISRDGGASGQSVLGGDDRRRRALPRHQRIGIVAFTFADQRAVVVVPRVEAGHEIGKPGQEALAQHPRLAEQIPPDARRDEIGRAHV